jgi:hypothetical protein
MPSNKKVIYSKTIPLAYEEDIKEEIVIKDVKYNETKSNVIPIVKSNKGDEQAAWNWLSFASENKYYNLDSYTPAWFFRRIESKGYHSDKRLAHLDAEERRQFLVSMVDRFWKQWFPRSFDYYHNPEILFFGEAWDLLIEEELTSRMLAALPFETPPKPDNTPRKAGRRNDVLHQVFANKVPRTEPRPPRKRRSELTDGS